MEKIKPKTQFDEKAKEEEKVYMLEDKDYLLIKAIRDLTKAIRKANFK